MPKKIYNILVTGAGGPAGVNAVRLLSAKKDRFNIYAVDSDPLSAGRFFADVFDVVPNVADYEEFKAEMNKRIIDWQIDCLLPTVAEELTVIKDVLGGYDGMVMISEQAVLETCHDKRLLYEWMDKNMPRAMIRWQTADQPLSFMADEYFIKPVTGRGSRGCRLVKKSELEFIMNSADADRSNIIIMEVLPGREWTVDAYVNSDGSFAYIVPRERLSLSGGISAKGKTVKNEQVIAISEELLKKMPCRGPVFMQWKLDRKSEPKLVEINPRLSGGMMITTAAGVNPIECMLAELDGEPKTDLPWEEVTVIRYFAEKVLK